MGKLLKKLLNRVWMLIRALFNINIPLKFVIILCVVLAAACVSVTQTNTINKVGGKAYYDEAMAFVEVKNAVADNFILDVNKDTLADSSASAMVNGLGDKWSYYMSADEYKAYTLQASNEYTGVGMSITKDASGGFQVLSVNAGSLAQSAGVGAGMVITAVDNEDVTGLDADDFRKLIRSKLNTKFSLTVSGSSDTITLDCASTYKSSVAYRLEKTEAGYVQIKDFEAGSGSDAVKAIETLLTQGATALVIDVRNNPGGLDGEVQTLLDYLLPEGKLFSVVDKNGVKAEFVSDSVCLQLPMVILINKGTFAEAEVFAAILQEYAWSTLMGESTTGMTRTQETILLSNGGAIRLSTGSYITANGVDICNKGGVVPESIIYNSDESATGTTSGTTGGEQGTASTSNDDQLMQALTYLSKNA